jgi:hypothetical protein
VLDQDDPVDAHEVGIGQACGGLRGEEVLLRVLAGAALHRMQNRDENFWWPTALYELT